MPDGERFVPVEQVIASHLDRLFPGMRVVGQYPFRVTRNADPALEEEEAEDLRTAVQEYLRRRRRSPQVVRLEIDDSMTEEVEAAAHARARALRAKTSTRSPGRSTSAASGASTS